MCSRLGSARTQGLPQDDFVFIEASTRFRSGNKSTRLTGFEPVTFGFVDRSGGSAGLCGARFLSRFREIEIGWNPWGFLPRFLPQRPDGADTSHRMLGELTEAAGSCKLIRSAKKTVRPPELLSSK